LPAASSCRQQRSICFGGVAAIHGPRLAQSWSQ
jgi:hypothetical protein